MGEEEEEDGEIRCRHTCEKCGMPEEVAILRKTGRGRRGAY